MSENLTFFLNLIEKKFSELPQTTITPAAKKGSKEPQPAPVEVFTRADAKVILTSLIKEVVERLDGIENTKDTESAALKEQVSSLEEKLLNTRLELEKNQQYQNRDTFKICGIKEPSLPPNVQEDTTETVTNFFVKAGVTLPKEELSMTHRLPSRETTRSKALLVKLRSRIVRNRLIRMKKDFRNNELLKGEYPDAFIVEHLTPLRAKVAYQLRNDESIERVWTIDGRIKVVKKGAGTNDKPITIDSLAQLTKLGPNWTKEAIKKLVFEA